MRTVIPIARIFWIFESSIVEIIDQYTIEISEADEFADGHIPGSLNMPLSTFQPSKLPDPGDRQLVLTCLGGKRSGIALDKCRAIEASADTHLAGGFGAWTAAGLPVER